MSKIVLVNPMDVVTNEYYVSRRTVRYQKDRLVNEGQIMPLVAHQDDKGQWVIDDEDWPYASSLVEAARELAWPTILVTDDAGED